MRCGGKEQHYDSRERGDYLPYDCKQLPHRCQLLRDEPINPASNIGTVCTRVAMLDVPHNAQTLQYGSLWGCSERSIVFLALPLCVIELT